MFRIHDRVRVPDSGNTFSQADTTNLSYKLYKITEIINATKPSYKIDQLPEDMTKHYRKRLNLQWKKWWSFEKIIFILDQNAFFHLNLR